MKKLFLYVLIAVGFFFVGSYDVFAYEISADEVGNSTYIIGTHMFNRETNSIYDGQLTTRHIMLASTTIESDSIDDMVIYYKNPRGKWIDGLTGEVITPPTSFEIEYLNALNYLNPPTISLSFAEADSTYGEVQNLNVDDLGTATGVQIYYATSTNGEYQLLYTMIVEEFINNQEVIIPAGYHYYYKIRLYKTIGEDTIYSDYSNVVDYDNSFTTPSLTLLDYGSVAEDGTISTTLSLNEVQGNVEIYYATSEDGEYTLLKTVGSGDEEYGQYIVSIPLGAHYYFKVRYVAVDDSNIYSGFSNVVSKDNNLVIPEVSLSFAGADSIGNIGQLIDVGEFGIAEGFEIYYSTSSDGEYTLLHTITVEEIEAGHASLTVLIPAGYHYYFKVRSYKTVGEDTVYSNYSNIVDYDNSFTTPSLTLLEYGAVATDGSETAFISLTEVQGNVEIYYATSEDGEYTLLRTVSAVEVEYGQFEVSIPLGAHYYFKVRYVAVDDNSVYSEFSNVVDYNNSFDAPTISLSFAGADSNNNIGQFLNVDEFGLSDSMEIYYATSSDGEYQLLKSVTAEEYANDQQVSNMIIPAGYHYYYKVRLYKTVGEDTIYSDYSNIVDYDNSFSAPELTLLEYGSVSEDGTISTTLSLNEVQGNVEIYYATSEDGEYTLLKTVGSGDEEYGQYIVTIPLGAHYYFKVRYVAENDNNVYSEFSNVVDYYNSGN